MTNDEAAAEQSQAAFAFPAPSRHWEARPQVSVETLDEDEAALIAAEEAAIAAENAEHGVVKGVADEPADDPDAATAAAPSDAPAGDAATAADAPATETPEEPALSAVVAGVASKDGRTVLPYGALKSARGDAKQYRLRAERAEQELADLKAGKKPEAESTELTDEYLQDVVADFPQLAPLVKAVQISAKAAPRAQAAAAEDDDDSDPLQEAIDSVPLLAGWQAAGGEEWKRAIKLDVALQDSPKWANKSDAERFAHVARLVADEFDIQVEKPDTAAPVPAPSKPTPQKAIESAARNAPNTLSDFKGGAPDATRDNLDRMPATSQLNRAMDMSDADLDAWLRKVG